LGIVDADNREGWKAFIDMVVDHANIAKVEALSILHYHIDAG
jgi:hypothetical protein